MTVTTPEDRFGHLFTLIGDPVVEIELRDDAPIVRTVNPAFETVFGYDRDRIRGESLNDFIVPEDRVEEATRFDRRTAANKPNTELVTRMTAQGPREFLYRGIPYDRDGGQYAFAIYTDLSDQRRYERHIQVVHRLLRHDLRTDLQVIMGTATQVADRATDEETVALAETIVDRAERLASVGEEARTVERILLDEHDPEPMDVAELCRRVAATLAHSYPDTTVQVSTPDTQSVVAVPQLRAALGALLDNAATHGGDSVDLSVRPRGDRVAVEVIDDGAGIPENVRAPVFEDSDITKLQHGRGIGLWLVRWVTEICGGRLEYDRHDGLTVVRLWLRSARTDDPSPAADTDSASASPLDNP
ncbi:PAS domain S-box-containing protein [Halorientalis persicus]|uniref:histidine kinase n=1 Tax=Halorientalis persicus TaxID=1367881 RepID=A0A1H8QQ34_9EURY|nr:PAS domain-containing sensor histidine kinase [Halorientalis persicus]SEO56330.1 PAS domain S-box-containing protein [Halorientalis persicus]